jgi:hypothetical protein
MLIGRKYLNEDFQLVVEVVSLNTTRHYIRSIKLRDIATVKSISI